MSPHCRTIMTKLWLLLCSSLLLVSLSAQAQDRVLTSLPVTYWLTKQLVAQTPIEVVYLPSPRFSLQRHQSWFDSEQQKVAKYAREATAVVTIRSIWPQDPIYPQVRQYNIHLVPIDAAQALTPRAPAVSSLRDGQGQISPYVWLNPLNLTTMLNNISLDLQQIFSSQQAAIQANQQRVARELQQQLFANQARLFNHEVESVVLLDEALLDFAAGYSLSIQGQQFKPELEWNTQDQQQLKQWLQTSSDVWVLTTRPPSPALKALLGEFSRYIVIDPLSRLGQGFDVEHPWQRWQIDLD
ncbi:metal ABC transporter solute-binding protein, Zn/Mn family [Vibrio metschnikovii]|uniref:metal ABC transporter solute-binding protein, Zn/Mn family n=1 Tax=Vibrio metschnikovii TaxID=28172 RepID=UPI002FC9637E